MQISVAKSEDFQEIRLLWEMVFEEDSKEYLDFYFDFVMNHNKVLLCRDEKKDDILIGMLHLNPYWVRNGEDTDQVYYIVAVATHVDYRRQGVMGKLLSESFQIAKNDNIKHIILLPEDERYYKPYGFEFVSTQFGTTIHANLYQDMLNDDTKMIQVNELESSDEMKNWFVKSDYKSKDFEAIITDSYILQLYNEMTCEGGKVAEVDGNLVLYYKKELITVRKYYLRCFENDEAKEKSLRKLASWLIYIAEGTTDKKLLLNEVEEKALSCVFPYSRMNNYDQRPYMMKYKSKKQGNGFYFDEVV